MSTTGMESWAVDLKDVGAIYPFQGSEGLLVIIVLATWIAWHIWQMRSEKNNHEEQVRKFGDATNVNNALDAD